jgi:hypothetical protein
MGCRKTAMGDASLRHLATPEKFRRKYAVRIFFAYGTKCFRNSIAAVVECFADRIHA